MLPYPDPDPDGQQPSWDEGHTLFLTEQMAIDRLNANESILPDYHLELVRSDSGCNIRSRATLALVRDTLGTASGHAVVGVVGPGCSTSATTVGSLSSRESIAVINVHVAGSLVLSDRQRYAYSFGTLDSTEVFVKTLLQLITDKGWSQVSMLYDESRLYYYSTVKLLEKTLREDRTYEHLDYFSSAVYSTYIPLDLIKNHHRIVLLFVGPDFLSKILCLALHKDMLYPVYQYVIVSRVADEIQPITFQFDGETVSCDQAEIRRVITSALVVHYQLKPLNETRETHSGFTYEEFDKQYREKVAGFVPPPSEGAGNLTIRPSFWAASFFDAVWSLGLALHNSTSNVNLSSYGFGQPDNSMRIREHLEELRYEGVSGMIWFNKSTGYVQRNVDIYQIDGSGAMEKIGYYSQQEEAIHEVVSGRTFITGEFINVTVILTAPRGLAAPVLVVTIVGFMLTLILQVLTIVYRDSKSVKATSPKVSQLAFVGCYIQVVGCLTNVCIDVYTDKISEEANCVLWHVLNIAAAIGTTLIFGTVCTRTWRLYRIFVHYRDPGRFMSEKVLVAVVLVFVIIDVLISIIWIETDPFEPDTKEEVVEYEEVKEGNVTVNVRAVTKIIRYCSQNYFVLWCVLLILFNTLLMGGAVTLAFLTRGIPHKNFKTRGIMSFTYILTGILGLGFSVYTILLTQLSYSVIVFRFVVVSVLLNGYVYLSCLLLFLPPLYPVLLSSCCS